ncbi:MAG: hypothetical protein HOP18_02745 [Deltaproteobacteria bacterium]|nr:hypothetical protein [Deltaproteobacteria bacterium]
MSAIEATRVIRDTKALFTDVGFQYQELREYYHPAVRFTKVCSWVMQGVATKPMIT